MKQARVLVLTASGYVTGQHFGPLRKFWPSLSGAGSFTQREAEAFMARWFPGVGYVLEPDPREWP